MFYIIDSKERRDACARHIAQVRSTPLMQVEIKPYKRNRSQSQNRLMWMWYHVIAEEIGCEIEDLHEQMKVRALGTERKVILGQAIIKPKSTTGLSVEEMTRFLEAIEALALDLGIILPRPDDYGHAMKRAA